MAMDGLIARSVFGRVVIIQAELTRSWLYLERLYVFSGRILPGPGFTWSGSPGSPG